MEALTKALLQVTHIDRENTATEDVARVTIELMPRHQDCAFISLLKQLGRRRKVRIENCKPTAEMAKVMKHVYGRWKKALNKLGDPPIRFFTADGTQITNGSVQIEDLCQQANVVNGSERTLVLEYVV